ncbi:glutaminase [Tropicimonas sp. IMCC34011]|uniref:glutaminase n=1 Tax=Tropicimonas sp. IMCC34011 TaxID=2248759 RepID=UPI000E233C12|nr:glutaminase [Tropicimonas sp. IMCC34011]
MLRAEREARSRTEKGMVASYIPELARVNPDHFAMSVCLFDGTQFDVGEADRAFSVQSISKIFTLAIALGRFGDDLWVRVGREPSTHNFNSIQELEIRKGHPPNPFMNAGAIVTTDTVLGQSTPAEAIAEILQFVRGAASDDSIYVDAEVAASETETGLRNWALAYCLKEFGNLENSCENVLGTYFHHCAIAMSCRQLARFGRFLAGITLNRNFLSERNVRRINALMLTSGHYNGSGEFAFSVGLPAKSGVGGGILAIVPGTASISVWSPGLDHKGNSLRGTQALQVMSEELRWSVFHA